MKSGSVPDTWVTVYSGDIGNTFGPKGFSIGSSLHVSWSKYPRSKSIKLTSEISSLTCLMLTLWPANTTLRLILRRLKQMRPHVVTVAVR